MELENTTLWGLIVAACFAIGPVLKEFTKHFLSNKIKHTQELDSVRILEEKSKLEERDKTFEFFKDLLEKRDKEFDILKDILSEIKDIVEENQFTDKKDFQSLVLKNIELLFLKLENSVTGIIERNHISKVTLETSYKKISNLIERDVNILTNEISEIHYHISVKKQIVDMLNYRKEDISTLLKEVISDYVESDLSVHDKRDIALRQLREAINYLSNSFSTSAQKIFN